MRVPFQLKNFEPFCFSVEGVTYTYPNVRRLAERRNLAANIHEYVVETPNGKKVWLTVVGDEDQTSAYGIQHGWYVAQVLSEENATFLVKALAEFTKFYEP
jgi:hydrogenase maturation factor